MCYLKYPRRWRSHELRIRNLWFYAKLLFVREQKKNKKIKQQSITLFFIRHVAVVYTYFFFYRVRNDLAHITVWFQSCKTRFSLYCCDTSEHEHNIILTRRRSLRTLVSARPGRNLVVDIDGKFIIRTKLSARLYLPDYRKNTRDVGLRRDFNCENANVRTTCDTCLRV